MTAGVAELPLDRGSAASSVTLHPLHCADVMMAPAWVHREPGPLAALRALGIAVPRDRLLRAPIVAFLLEHPQVGPILVDTGFDAGIIEDKGASIGRVNSLIFRGVRMRREQAIASQLRARGIAPTEIELVLMTHLHADHAGALGNFPNATVLVAEAEWRAATARGASLAGYHGPHLAPGLDYRLLRLPEALADGPARLEQAIDVLGDGSIRLLPTPGHTPGHLSVIARLGDREALIAGDAVYTLATLREGERAHRAVDRGAYEASIAVLAAYDRANPGAIVIPGHDREAWRELEESLA